MKACKMKYMKSYPQKLKSRLFLFSGKSIGEIMSVALAVRDFNCPDFHFCESEEAGQPPPPTLVASHAAVLEAPRWNWDPRQGSAKLEPEGLSRPWIRGCFKRGSPYKEVRSTNVKFQVLET